MENCWFVDWFNTKYYHILYKQRNDSEAQLFIDNLLLHLNLSNNSKIIDVACGKGRHSKYLSSKGFEVTGIDLSVKSIAAATQFETEKLTFFEHDMRKPFRVNYFDAAVNLFTSLGYFENEDDNYKAIKSVANSLKKNGVLVIDFFNEKYVAKNLMSKFEVELEGINFNIEKKIENGFVYKNIAVYDDGKIYNYQEKVQLISLKNFEDYLKAANVDLKWLAGDYSLHTFNIETSERLILCAQKN